MPVEADSDLICQSGVRWEDINSTLKEKGIPLFFPVSCVVLYDPSFALLTLPIARPWTWRRELYVHDLRVVRTLELMVHADNRWYDRHWLLG